MLRHYLIAALRHFVRHKLYTFINVVGLAVALACAILILLFVRYQLSYDEWVPDSANLYRLELTLNMISRPPLPQARNSPSVRDLLAKIPEVNAITYLAPEEMTVTVGNRQFLETVARADANLLEIIRLPLLSGEAADVLAHPGSVIISQAMAKDFFGAADPVGKFLTLRGSFGARSFQVTGVLRNLPANSQLVANIIVPDSAATGIADSAYIYVRLIAGARPQRVLQELKPILDATFHVKFGNYEQTASELEQFHLTRFRDVHLAGGRYGGMTPAGNPALVYGFAIIALLIVLTASANFMNLATARATLRAREMGLRKLGGAARGQLVVQFLSEASLVSAAALVAAMALVETLLPVYDRLLGEPIRPQYPADWKLLAAFAGGTFALGLLGAAYPALVLSRFRPAEALRAGGASPTGSGIFRSLLVLGQFAVSIGLGVAALVIFRQIDFARGLDLGFDRDHIIVIRGMSDIAPGSREGFMRELLRGTGIVETALADDVPFEREPLYQGLEHAQGSSQPFSAHFVDITPDYPSLLGMRLLAGRLLSATRGEDVRERTGSGVWNILINAETARQLDVPPAAAVGRIIVPAGRVVGVLEDAKVRGVQAPVMPVIYQVDPSIYRAGPVHATELLVRVSGGDLPRTLAFIDRTGAHGHRVWPRIVTSSAPHSTIFSRRKRDKAPCSPFSWRSGSSSPVWDSSGSPYSPPNATPRKSESAKSRVHGRETS